MPVALVVLNLRAPFTVLLMPRHAGVSAGVAAVRPLVLHISKVVNLAQVGDAVVRSIAVDMVDFGVGPYAIDVQPCKPVGAVTAAIDFDNDVPTVVQSTGKLSGRNHAKSVTRSQPVKAPSIGFIPQYFLQQGLG